MRGANSHLAIPRTVLQGLKKIYLFRYISRRVPPPRTFLRALRTRSCKYQLYKSSKKGSSFLRFLKNFCKAFLIDISYPRIMPIRHALAVADTIRYHLDHGPQRDEYRAVTPDEVFEGKEARAKVYEPLLRFFSTALPVRGCYGLGGQSMIEGYIY